MIFTVLVPEYIIGKALNERLAVKSCMIRSRRTLFPADYEEIYFYMANMGYFVLNLEGH